MRYARGRSLLPTPRQRDRPAAVEIAESTRSVAGINIPTRQHMPTLIIYPKLSDPRVAQIGILSSFLLLGKAELRFQISWVQIATVIACVCLLDIVLGYYHTGTLTVPASGLISGLSLALLLRAPTAWPFFTAGFATALGKHFIRLQRRHIFNPSNFGLIVSLALPWTHARVAPDQWGHSWAVVFLVLNLGFFMVYKVRRFHLVVSFLTVFASISAVESGISITSMRSLIEKIDGGSFLLFTFFMITDPQTSPGTMRIRMVYGTLIAGADAILRIAGAPYSLFIALLAVCGGYACQRLLAEGAPPDSIWRIGIVSTHNVIARHRVGK